MEPWDATSDDRIAAHIDILADVTYARLLSAARGRGLGVLVIPSDGIESESFVAFKTACAEILVELLNRSGVLVAVPA
jgi:hypothetical protein